MQQKSMASRLFKKMNIDDQRCGSTWIHFGMFFYILSIEVPYQVLTTGEDACLRFWDLRLHMEGSPRGVTHPGNRGPLFGGEQK